MNVTFLSSVLLLLSFCGSEVYAGVRINEVVVSNLSSIEDKTGERFDWIELYNDGNSTEDISGYYLSDDTLDRKKWQFGSCHIAANDYLLVWASGKDITIQSEKPQNIPGLSAWFSASNINIADTASVSADNDKLRLKSWASSAGSNSAFQTDSTFAPEVVVNCLGGYPVVRFDGADDFLDSDLLPPLEENARTIIVVVANANTVSANKSTNNYILQYGSYGTNKCYGILFQSASKGGAIGNGYYKNYAYGSKTMDADFHTISAVYDGAVDQFFVDREQILSNRISLNTGSTQTLKIASKMGSGKDFYGGDIADIIVYDRALNDEERSCVEGYFMEKYGLSKQGNHTNFKLNKKEALYLSNAKGDCCDSIINLDMPDDWSKGINSAGNLTLFEAVTPLELNANLNYKGTVKKPKFSHKAGFYSDNIKLTIEVDSNDPIYYTLDGSEPTKASQRYTGAIKLSDVSENINRLSLIKTTLDGEGFDSWNEPLDTVYKFNIVRARVIKDGYYPGEIETHAYVIDKDATSQFKYPVVSLVSDSLNFFDDHKGIYIAGANIDSTDYTTANFAQSGDAWERPVNIEIFDPNGDFHLHQDAGVRIHGNFTRTANIKSLRFYARKEYGDSDFDYQFFKDKEQDSYKRFILRNSGNDYAWAYMRDVLMQDISNNLPFDTQNSQVAEVYLNGEFWGIHYMKERYDRFYLKENYGLEEDEVDIVEDYYTVVNDDDNNYKALLKFIGNNDMSDSLNYAYLNTKLDTESYLNYIACNWFFAQNDWPQNNYKYWRKKTDTYTPDAPYGHDGKWRCMMFDTDYGFGRIQTYTFDIVEFMLNEMTGWSVVLLQNLIGSDEKPGNPEFRRNFITTLADLMNANFKEEYTLSKIDSMVNLLDVKIDEHIRRWSSPKNRAVWEGKVDVLREFALNRPTYMREHMISQFDEITDTTLVTLHANATMGSIQINRLMINSGTRGISDPKQPFPWYGIYFKGLPIELTAHAKPGYRFIKWQGYGSNDTLRLTLEAATSITAVFEPIALKKGEVLFNEYVENDSIVWFELANATNKSLVLDGYELVTGNSSFTIDHAILDSGEFLVVCNDTSAFRQQYAFAVKATGDMSLNSGFEDGVLFKSENGVIIDSIKLQTTYRKTFFSTERTEEESSQSTWQASFNIGGTPGYQNSTPAYALVINELMAKNNCTVSTNDGEFEDWIELYNPLDIPVDLSGLYLTDKISNRSKYTAIPEIGANSNIIEANKFKLLWADKSTEAGCDHIDIKLSADGDQIVLLGSDGKFIIDSLTYSEQLPDISYGRLYDAAYAWKYFRSSTPDASNGIIDTENNGGLGADNDVCIYPNPTKSTVTIIQNGAKGIEIYDIYGTKQYILCEKKDYGFVIDASGSLPGVYFLVIKADDKRITKKLIVTD